MARCSLSQAEQAVRSTAHIAIASILGTCASLHSIGCDFFFHSAFHRKIRPNERVHAAERFLVVARFIKLDEKRDASIRSQRSNRAHSGRSYFSCTRDITHHAKNRIHSMQIPIAIDRSCVFLFCPLYSSRCLATSAILCVQLTNHCTTQKPPPTASLLGHSMNGRTICNINTFHFVICLVLVCRRIHFYVLFRHSSITNEA